MNGFFARHLNTRDRRALAGLAIAAVAFLLFDFAILPLVDSAGGLRASLPLKEKTLRKYQGLVLLAGAREAGWQSFQTRLAEAEKGVLESRTAALALAELQERVKQLLSQQGLEPRAAVFMPVHPIQPAAAGYTAVPLSLSFECTVDQLSSFLLAARAGSKTLALEQLAIDAVPQNSERPKKLIAVRMVIRGVMVAETAAAPKS